MAIVLLTLKASVAFSEQCEAKLVLGVLLLYLVVSSALVAARLKRAAKLHLAVQ